MFCFTSFVLLAALSTTSVAGPVPRENRRQLFTRYSNASSTPQAVTVPPIPSTIASILDHDSVNVDTALVVEPIQETVLTHVVPAITFFDPDGKPLATEDPQTLFSTSYVTPTPAPSIPQPSSTSAGGSPSSHSAAPSVLPSQSDFLGKDPNTPTRSAAAVENGTSITASRSVPLFTYSPEEEETLASTFQTSTNSATANITNPTSGVLPGFTHPASRAPIAASSIATNLSATTASSYSLSIIQFTPPSASGNATTNNPASDNGGFATESLSRVLVTKTEYTTVFAPQPTGSPEPSEAQNVPESPLSPSSAMYVSTTLTGIESGALQPSSAPAISLPETSLSMPPMVIITQYTTVIPTPTPAETVDPIISSSIAESDPPTATSSLPSPDYSASQAPSSLIPSSTLASSPNTTTSSLESSSAYSTLLPPFPSPSPTESASVPTNAPAPAPEPTTSSTSEGPLIITPISPNDPPSETATVTVTTTEKETVKETVTVTVTA